ncbi:GNAT family N-acetyltransferase [Streptomyces lunalinharesii]|uniref:N-acetyltransferase domain-containing protein n=1 Tax=Streptomyces lunalinharesii TaxID=333384 RepID=A0ABN3SKN3_9ACTN
MTRTAALGTYLSHPELPYLAPPSWLHTQEVVGETRSVLALAEDETGNPRRKPLIPLPGRHHRWHDDVTALAATLRAEPDGTRMVVMETEAGTRHLTERADALPWKTDFDWYGMVREVHDPGPAERAVSLAQVPHLIPAAFRLWNDESFAAPIDDETSRRLTAEHPLWLAENAYVVTPDGEHVVATARLHIEKDGLSEPFAFLRGLIVARTARDTSSLSALTAVYAALMDRLRADGVPRCHLKVAADNHRLRQFYELLGFGVEARVRELSVPVGTGA